MTVLTSAPRLSSIQLQGLDKIDLPFVSADAFPGLNYQLGAGADDKYIVETIDGLDPPEADVAIANTASGGKYQGRTYQTRELVILLSLNPDWDAGETPKLLRDNLYTMINTGYNPKVKVTLMAGPFPYAYTWAYVKKFESALFSKDPVVQITMECLDYTFKDLVTTTYAPADMNANNPNIFNFGTAETGFQFQVKFLDDMSKWSIKQAENQNIGMEFVKDFNENDILAVSTIPGARYIHWNKHRGKVQNKMGILTNASEWIALHPGANHFVLPKGYGTKWQWKGKLQFTAQYWGA